jgi:hypothetical protein
MRVDLTKERQPNTREAMPIQRKKRGKLSSMNLKKTMKTKKHMLVVKKAIGQESPVSKSLSRIGC